MKKLSLSLLMVLWSAVASAEFSLSGSANLAYRFYPNSALDDRQYEGGNLSLILEPELYMSWNDNQDSLLFIPYLQADQHDDERSHADIRELTWVHVADQWELRAGLRREFWGVTEFQHLVDVINQFDNVVDIDNEDKLGQPMINLSLVRDWGILDLYILPGFRERSYPGVEGRLRPAWVVETGLVEYESDQEDEHIDYAVRWSHSMGDFDLGLSWFEGTNREPILQPRQNGDAVILVPYYEQMSQLATDIQATLGDWLWKFEMLYRDSGVDSFFASQLGFEYSRYGILQSDADLGWLLEYGWDERGQQGGVAQNDVFLGARLAMNDVNSSELLAGFSHDLDSEAQTFLIEGSRRIGNSWKASITARIFESDDSADPMTQFRQEDMLELSLEYFWSN